MRLVLGIAGFGMVCGLVAGCGGDDDSGEPDPPAAVAGNAPTTGGGSNGGSGAGGASSTGGAATGGGMAAVQRCDGSFAASQTLFNFGGDVASSLSITADELELFYVNVATAEDTHDISVLKRSSKSAAFSRPTVVSELQATCAAENYPALDVSDDGLRMYFTCLDGPAPLRRATRASRSAAWVVDPDPVGTVGDSITVSGDERTAVGVRELASNPRSEAYTRAAANLAFGPATAVTGIDQSFMNPDLSFDGRVLFGVVSTEGAQIAFVTLDDDLAATGAPSTAGMPPPPPGTPSNTVYHYTPTVTPDCRSIYFLRGIAVANGGGVRQYTLEYSQR